MSFLYQNGVCSNNRRAYRSIIPAPRLYAMGIIGVCAASVTAYAQDTGPSGLTTSLDITQRLEYSDNPDFDIDGDADFYGRTILGFGLESVRSIDQFSLNLGADIEEGQDSQSTVDMVNPVLGLTYNRDTRNAFISLTANYRESDQNSDNFDDFDQNGNVISQNDGTRKSYRVGLEGGVGQTAPIGAQFRWNYSDVTFSGTNDPDLNDSTNNDLSGQIDFRIDPRITASLTAKYIDFDTSGTGVDRETTGLGTAVSLDVTPIDTVDVFLSYDRIERSGGDTGTNEGVSAGVDWTRLMPNGNIAVSYETDVASNEDGRRNLLRLSRTMELPRGGLSVSFGLTGEETIGSDPLVDLSYTHERPTAQMTFGLSQSVNTDNDNNEQISTRLNAAYDQQINSLSSLGLSVALFDRNELQDNSNDGRRIDISLSYRHDLTRDWGLIGGYTHSVSKENDEDDRSSNTIFIGLQRSFNWSP